MRTTILPLLCLLAACGPSEVEVAEAQRAKTAAEAGGVGAGEAPVDLGEGLILTVLARGPGEFVPTGGRVRVHYTADVVAIADPEPEPEPEGEGDSEAEAEAEAEAKAEATNDAESETPTEEAPAAEETQEGAADATEADADAPAEPEADASETEAADAEPSEAVTEGPTLPLRFDSSRARGVPDVWDLSRTAKPRLIEGLRRGLVGLTAGTRATLYVPAALAWGEEGLPSGKVPPRADVLYEIELFEVLP